MPSRYAQKPASNISPSQIRQRCRDLSRAESQLPKVKWASFREAQRTEERAAAGFERKLEGIGEFSRGIYNANVDKVLGRIRRGVDKQMKRDGGTAFSIIRGTFLNWDADASGEMSRVEVKGALNSLGLKVSAAEVDSLVNYYDLTRSGEMKYQPLVSDITKLAPHFLAHPNTERLMFEKSVDSSRRVIGDTPRKVMPRICEVFLSKLQRNLRKIMREKGGTELSILRANFMGWDGDRTGMVSALEFRAAMNIFNLNISESEAKEMVDYYKKYDHDVEMRYEPMVHDIVKGTSHFLTHPATGRVATPSIMAVNKDDTLEIQDKKQAESLLFSARPPRQPPNAVIESFKTKLRIKLESQMRSYGGTIYSICRENFLMWDGDCSGALDEKEFTGAIRKMGVLEVSPSDIKMIVKYYDIGGKGEMRYQELVDDVVVGVPHFMVHSRLGANDVKGTIDPRAVAMSQNCKVIVGKIRVAADLAASKAVTVLSGEEMFYGTCIRFDKLNTGKVTKDGLKRVLKAINFILLDVELRHLIGWYDCGGEDVIVYKDLVRDTFSSKNMLPTGRDRDNATSQALVSLSLSTASKSSRSIIPVGDNTGRMDFKSDVITARGKRAGVLAEKARIERKIKDIISKEKEIRKGLESGRSKR